MQTVLSTKKLEPHQKNLLLNTGIALVEYNAIKIDLLEFEVNSSIENVIITSKNAAKAIVHQQVPIDKCFCVGEKTSAYLRGKGYYIAEQAHYGKDLAKIIVEKYSESKFTFFCGNLRRDELPVILNENHVELKETAVYKTSLNTKEFDQMFDGIMFFSPSAVQSFTAQNALNSATAFCIGATTASEVKPHTEKIIIATKPSIENVIVQVVKKYRQ